MSASDNSFIKVQVISSLLSLEKENETGNQRSRQHQI